VRQTTGANGEAEVKRIPALIVSGFLGSGKTTLVRHLLREAQSAGLRAAVVSNELGRLGIDRALLGGRGDALVELEGGCVCCQLSSELLTTLETLRERVEPDQIIIETSGVALPGDVQLNLWREPVAGWISDDVAVVVVNAEQVLEGRDLEGTFEYQVTSADLLLLNKMDLVPEAAAAEIETRLRAAEPEAPVVRVVHCAVSPAVLFPPDPGSLRAQRRANPAPAAPHNHEAFSVRELSVGSGEDEAALVERLRALGALRIKGVVDGPAGPRLVQGVGRRIHLSAASDSIPSELIGRLIVIERKAGC